MKLINSLGNILYWIVYGLVWIYFKFVHRIEIKGKENRPKNGSVIIMANHITAFDPPLIGIIMNRKVHFMAKEELFKNPIMDKLFRAIGTFPVKRGRPDRGALRESFRLLDNDKVICIFPEGTRSKTGKLGKAKAGATMIALKSKSPILPVAIKKEKNNLKFRVSIGESFTLDEYYDKKIDRDKRKKISKDIMNKIENELNEI